jgi:hypothetical protein
VTVLGNLIDNAVDAAQGSPAARVTVTARADEAGLTLRVSDTGPGVDPAHLEAVFERGWSTKATAGRGIGLALVHQTVTKHEGTLTVRDSPEGGAEFEVHLAAPAAGADPGAGAGTSGASAAGATAPGAGASAPGTARTTPDVGTTAPAAGATTPGSGTGTSGAGAGTSAAGATAPGTVTTAPGTGTGTSSASAAPCMPDAPSRATRPSPARTRTSKVPNVGEGAAVPDVRARVFQEPETAGGDTPVSDSTDGPASDSTDRPASDSTDRPASDSTDGAAPVRDGGTQ